MTIMLAIAALQIASLTTNADDKPVRLEMRDLASCKERIHWQEYSSIASLPTGVRDILSKFFKPGYRLAEAGAPYNSTDVIDSSNTPQRRFVRAYRKGETWLIWYEHGGIASSFQSIAVNHSKMTNTSDISYWVVPNSSLSGNVCITTTAYFNGVRPGGGP